MIKQFAFVAVHLFANTCAAQPPHKVSLSYDLSYNGVVAAELTEVLEHDGKSFSLTSEGRGKGIGALLYGARQAHRARGERARALARCWNTATSAATSRQRGPVRLGPKNSDAGARWQERDH